jgi:crotonobetainyl-CoA:carnitine CoA-transferase CaiB-like acyl-CoA transferase
VALIVDLSVLSSGRFCAQLVASADDEVIRFRSAAAVPAAASISRNDVRDAYLAHRVQESYVEWSNRDDRQIVEKAIKRADVVISSFSAGTFDSPYDDGQIRELNPRVVHVVLSPFGIDGPYRRYLSSSLTDWAASGYLYITGEPGRPPLAGPSGACAYASGYIAAIAVEAGLAQLRSGGPAATLDISHVEAMLNLHHGSFARLTAGQVMHRSGNDVGPATYPHGSYPCRTGEIFLGIVTDEEWDRFLIAVDRPELCNDSRLAAGSARKTNADLTDDIVASWTAPLDAAKAASFLQERRVPATECAKPEDLLHDPQLEYRHYFRDVSVLDGQVTVRLPGEVVVPRWLNGRSASQSPASLKRASQLAASQGDAAPLPLAGVTVVDLSIWWAGPLATRILGDLGANVIRVERPTLPRQGFAFPAWHRFVHEDMNRNKRSIVVDLSRPEGVEIVQRLIAKADVLVQNYRPGVLERLGLGWGRTIGVNPSLVYVSLSGYGSDGPKSEWGTYGSVAEAASCMRALTHYPGEGGMRLGDQLPDGICGLAGVLAALRGLRQRVITGSGCIFDISQLEASVSLVAEDLGEAALRRAGVQIADEGNGVGLDQLYRCRGEDEWVAVSWRDAESASRAAACLQEITGAGRDTDLNSLVTDFAAARTKQSVAECLQACGVAVFPVMTSRDLVDDVHLKARRFFTSVVLDGVTGQLPGSPVRSPHQVLTAFRRHAPMEGEHTVEILRDELLMTQGDIRQLLEARVVRQYSAD